jgi:hypothetical protein
MEVAFSLILLGMYLKNKSGSISSTSKISYPVLNPKKSTLHILGKAPNLFKKNVFKISTPFFITPGKAINLIYFGSDFLVKIPENLLMPYKGMLLIMTTDNTPISGLEGDRLGDRSETITLTRFLPRQSSLFAPVWETTIYLFSVFLPVLRQL